MNQENNEIPIFKKPLPRRRTENNNKDNVILNNNLSVSTHSPLKNNKNNRRKIFEKDNKFKLLNSNQISTNSISSIKMSINNNNKTKQENFMNSGRNGTTHEYDQQLIQKCITCLDSFIKSLQSNDFNYYQILIKFKVWAAEYLDKIIKNDKKQMKWLIQSDTITFDFCFTVTQKEQKSQSSQSSLENIGKNQAGVLDSSISQPSDAQSLEEKAIIAAIKYTSQSDSQDSSSQDAQPSSSSNDDYLQNQIHEEKIEKYLDSQMASENAEQSNSQEIDGQAAPIQNNIVQQNEMSIENSSQTVGPSQLGNEIFEEKSSSHSNKSVDISQIIDENQIFKQKQALIKQCIDALEDVSFNLFLKNKKSNSFQKKIKQVAVDYVEEELSGSNNKNVFQSIIKEVLQFDYKLQIKNNQLDQTFIHNLPSQDNNAAQLGPVNKVEQEQVKVDFSENIQQSNQDNILKELDNE